MLEQEYANSNELDITQLKVGQQYVKLAFVSDLKIKTTEYGLMYCTLYLKDCNANLVIGNIFNIEDTNYDWVGYKGKSVSVTFVAREFNGSITLNIIKLELSKEIIDYRKFIGVVPDAEASEVFINAVFTKMLGEGNIINPRAKMISLRYIANGKCGGYAKVVHLALQKVLAYKGLPNVDLERLSEVIYLVQGFYMEHMVAIEKLDFITNIAKIKFLSSVYEGIQDKDIAAEVVDTLLVLVNLGKPERYNSKLISEAFLGAIEDLHVNDIYKGMIPGSRKQFNDINLLKI